MGVPKGTTKNREVMKMKKIVVAVVALVTLVGGAFGIKALMERR